jgi:micrococcal nuclease
MTSIQKPLQRLFKTLRIPKTYATFAVLVVGAVLSVSSGSFSKNADQVRVVQVIDGDTIDVDSGKTVRYIGIDTPETRKRTSDGWVPTGDEGGEDAKKANEDLVLGKMVRLEYDVEKKDKYGRTLAYVFVRQGEREVLAQTELLRRGLAFLYTIPPNVRYVDVFMAAQEEAHINQTGLWKDFLEIPAVEAHSYEGQRKFVVGGVNKVRRTKSVITLSMDGLNVAIFNKDLSFFEKAGIRPAQDYMGRQLRVFGLIKSYRGSPEIIASHPGQIEVLE